MEAQGKALIQHKAELEAAAQAQQQELGALQQEVARLRKELQGWETERELTNILETSLDTPGIPMATSPETTVCNSYIWLSYFIKYGFSLVPKRIFCPTNPVCRSATAELHS